MRFPVSKILPDIVAVFFDEYQEMVGARLPTLR